MGHRTDLLVKWLCQVYTMDVFRLLRSAQRHGKATIEVLDVLGAKSAVPSTPEEAEHADHAAAVSRRYNSLVHAAVEAVVDMLPAELAPTTSVAAAAAAANAAMLDDAAAAATATTTATATAATSATTTATTATASTATAAAGGGLTEAQQQQHAEQVEQSRALLSKLLHALPEIPSSVLRLLRSCAEVEARMQLGLLTLRDLITARPSYRPVALRLLLGCCTHSYEKLRSTSIRLVSNKLFVDAQLADTIEEYARGHLRMLEKPKPADDGGDTTKETANAAAVTSAAAATAAPAAPLTPEREDEIKQHLFLYLALCTKKQSLLQGLFDLYAATTPDVRRVMHRAAVQVVRTIGMQSAALLGVLSNVNEATVPFALRILHVLTDNVSATPELTECVRTAYELRLRDARLLIPILPVLKRKYVISQLGALVALPLDNVKMFVQRILKHKPSPLTASELLVQLHLIDTKLTGVPLKRVIEATQLCFAYKEEYTQDVFAVVLQQLSDEPKTPALLMRSIILIVGRCPNLTSFVTSTVMMRLIGKQVWQDKRLWEGFVKVCQYTKPHSLPVIMKLPLASLVEDVLVQAPDIEGTCRLYYRHNRRNLPRLLAEVFTDKAAQARQQKRAEKQAAAAAAKAAAATAKPAAAAATSAAAQPPTK